MIRTHDERVSDDGLYEIERIFKKIGRVGCPEEVLVYGSRFVRILDEPNHRPMHHHDDVLEFQLRIRIWNLFQEYSEFAYCERDNIHRHHDGDNLDADGLSSAPFVYNNVESCDEEDIEDPYADHLSVSCYQT